MSAGDDEPDVDPNLPGPFDDFTDCTTLEAGVVEEDDSGVYVHGYSVSSDLSQHYSFAELILLSLTGEPPDEQTGRAFEILAHFVAPVSVAEAPVHAARLGQVIGTEPASLAATTAVGLSEQARSRIDEFSDLIDWLDEPKGDVPDCVRADDSRSVHRAKSLLGALDAINFDAGIRDERPGFWPTVVATAWKCGLKSRGQLVSALVTIRIPVAVAEATSIEGKDLRDYPMNLESFEYRHVKDDDE